METAGTMTKIILSIVFIVLFVIAFNRANHAQEQIVQIEAGLDDVQSEYHSVVRDINEYNLQLSKLQIELDWIGNRAVQYKLEMDAAVNTYKNGFISHSMLETRVNEINEKILDLKRQHDSIQIDIDKIEFEKESNLPFLEARQESLKEKLTESPYKDPKVSSWETSREFWGLGMVVCILVLLAVCPPIRFLAYLILAVCTLGWATKAFNK